MAQDAQVGSIGPLVERGEPRASGPAGRFPCFDGLRAIAALAVLAAHSIGYVYYRYHEGRSFAPLVFQEWMARLGGFGVAIFFVISGFLLYRPFVLASFRALPSPRVLPFWMRRFIRIFPAYWVVVTVSIFIIGNLQPAGFLDYLTFYGLLLNYRAGYATLGIGVEWTLVIELSFYLVLPALALGLRSLTRADAPVRTKYRAQVVGLVVLAAFATAWRAWHLWFFHPKPSTLGTWFAPSEISTWLISYLDWFIAGMLLAVVSSWLASGGRIPSFIAVLARRPWLAWLLAFECYGIVTRLRYPMYGYWTPRPAQEFLRMEMCIAAATLLVLPAVFGNQETGLIRWALRSRPLVWLGLISYGIYLWHVPLFKAAEDWWDSSFFPDNPIAQVVVIISLTFLAATASYLVVERPTRKWAQGLTRRNLAPVPAAVRGPSPATDIPASVTRPDPTDVGEPEPDDEVLPLVIYGAIAILLPVIGLVLPSVPPFG